MQINLVNKALLWYTHTHCDKLKQHEHNSLLTLVRPLLYKLTMQQQHLPNVQQILTK